MTIDRIRSSISQFTTDRQPLVPVLIISTGIFALSGILGFLVEKIPIMLMFGAIGGLVFAVIAIRSMSAALTLLIATSTTVGFMVDSNIQLPLPFSMFILVFLIGIWVLRMTVIDHQIKLVPNRINLPFLGFIVSALISWIVGYALNNWRMTMHGNLISVKLGKSPFLF